MNFVLRLAVVEPNDAAREALTKALSSVETLWLEGECSRYELFPSIVDESQPDVALVSLDADVPKALALIESLHRDKPECNVCAMSKSTEGGLILRAMRAGAKEFIPLPLDLQEFLTVIKKVSRHGDTGSQNRRECVTMTVAGAAGGVGATSLAVNLASILAMDPSKSVVLVDLDVALGDTDVFLDAKPDYYTLVDIAENISRLDFDLLKRSLTKLKSGLFLLPRPVHLIENGAISDEILRRVLGMLKSAFSHVIIDVSKGYTPLDLTALQCSDLVLLVTQLNLPNLRNVMRLMRSFKELDGLDERVKIVVNRSEMQAEPIRLNKAEEIIRHAIFWQLPNDYRLMVDVCNNGVPLVEYAPKAELTRSLTQMCRQLYGEEAPAEETAEKPAAAPRGRFFGLWSAKAK
jgi:pilus assembly protein CpaE